MLVSGHSVPFVVLPNLPGQCIHCPDIGSTHKADYTRLNTVMDQVQESHQKRKKYHLESVF